MQNMKSYFSSWKPFWKSSHSGTLTLAPSSIHFTNSSLGDLKNSIIDEKLMIDISRKLLASIAPPKLQICAHHDQWFALNNSHLLVYRQLERSGLCDTVVCDIIRSEDVPIGIRQTLIPVATPQLEHGPNADQFMPINDEVVYCADMQADSCGCLDDEDSVVTGDEDDNSDDEQNEWSSNTPSSLSQIPAFQPDQLDDDELDGCQRETESLL